MAVSLTSRRARIAALSRSRAVDDPDLLAERRDLAAVRLEEHVREVVASAPPLTEDQRARIVAALTPTSRPGGSSLLRPGTRSRTNRDDKGGQR